MKQVLKNKGLSLSSKKENVNPSGNRHYGKEKIYGHFRKDSEKVFYKKEYINK